MESPLVYGYGYGYSVQESRSLGVEGGNGESLRLTGTFAPLFPRNRESWRMDESEMTLLKPGLNSSSADFSLQSIMDTFYINFICHWTQPLST